MKQPEPEFLTVAEASELLRVTRPGLIYMIKHDKLPGARKISEKLTSAWLIPMSAIKAHPNYIARKQRGQAAKAT